MQVHSLRTPTAAAPRGQRSCGCHAFKPQRKPEAAALEAPTNRLAGLVGAAAALSLLVSPPSLAAEPFLKATGAAGGGVRASGATAQPPATPQLQRWWVDP